MAAASAEYLGADQLVYLTDVEGVLAGEAILSRVAADEIGALVERKTVSGGMVLKLEAAKRALEGGVRSVHIVGGGIPDGLLAAVAGADPARAGTVPGTRVVRESPGIAALSAA